MEQKFYCPECGGIVTYGDKFCNYCGVQLDWSLQEETASPEEAQDFSYQQEGQWEQPYSEQRSEFGQVAGTQPGAQYRRKTGAAKHKKYIKQSTSKGFFSTLYKNGKLTSTGIISLAVAVILVASIVVFSVLGNGSGNPPENPVNPPSETPTTPTTPAKPVDEPKIIKFNVDPSVIPGGQSTKLSWEVKGATTVLIDQGIGKVSESGTKTITPEKTTIYMLTATNSAGTVTAKTTVTVHQQAPKIVSFTATPSVISSGQSSTLKWNVTGADKVEIQGIGNVESSGEKVVSPGSTITYTLTATNKAGVITATATVTVEASGKPVITTFTASDESINAGESVKLEWYVTGANSVTINPDIGSVSAYGTRVVKPSATTTYTLTAVNNAGTSTLSVTITVAGSSNKPVIVFTASRLYILKGDSVTLNWTVTNATTISINQGIGTVSASGSRTETPNTTTVYTLTATNANGTSTASLTITVGELQKPVIISFTASQTTITAGEPVTLSWNVSGATTVTLSQGIGTVPPSDSLRVYPTSTITYILTARNDAGFVEKEVKITVTGSW